MDDSVSSLIRLVHLLQYHRGLPFKLAIMSSTANQAFLVKYFFHISRHTCGSKQEAVTSQGLSPLDLQSKLWGNGSLSNNGVDKPEQNNYKIIINC